MPILEQFDSLRSCLEGLIEFLLAIQTFLAALLTPG
jgi:hypothetical protein